VPLDCQRDHICAWLVKGNRPTPTGNLEASHVRITWRLQSLANLQVFFMAKEKVELLKGTLDMLILEVVALGPIHGYAIARRIQQISQVFFLLQQGSLQLPVQAHLFVQIGIESSVPKQHQDPFAGFSDYVLPTRISAPGWD